MCPDMELLNGDTDCSYNNEVGSICTHECHPDFNLIGHAQSTCVKTEVDQARWSPPFPQCTGNFMLKENDLFAPVLSVKLFQ